MSFLTKKSCVEKLDQNGFALLHVPNSLLVGLSMYYLHTKMNHSYFFMSLEL